MCIVIKGGRVLKAQATNLRQERINLLRTNTITQVCSGYFASKENIKHITYSAFYKTFFPISTTIFYLHMPISTTHTPRRKTTKSVCKIFYKTDCH
jgi:hypothetical protein